MGKAQLSTVDLRVLTTLEHLILKLQTYLTFLQNNEEVNRTETSLSASIPWLFLFSPRPGRLWSRWIQPDPR
jgi:hypothetical protein